MKNNRNKSEEKRLALQTELDSGKNQAERNRMGQFATPSGLALDILRYAKRELGGKTEIRFIDPAIGTGAFYSALIDVFSKNSIRTTVGYEIDSYYGIPAENLWGGDGLEMRHKDFTCANTPENDKRFNLLICNPPYVRHHHIINGDKKRLKLQTREACGVEINGLAGLYCYYMGLSQSWMADGGLAGWLIPSEFMDVNYGAGVKKYLLEKVTLLHIHRFNPNEIQFSDALVSSVVVWFRKEKPPLNHCVRFSYGGTLEKPEVDRQIAVSTLTQDPKWTRYPMKESYEPIETPILSDFFTIKRGLATGNNSYFILPEEEIKSRGLPLEAFRPILPSPRYLGKDEVSADREGNPLVERRLFLLDCPLSEDEIGERYPALRHYLEEGKEQGIADRYLCQHRKPWYTQEKRPPAPFVCTYLGRSDKKSGRPFRFILNHSKATAANVYLMLYPKKALERQMKKNSSLRRRIWRILNGICPKSMLNEGRVYGGGLHKLEPRELGNVPAKEIAVLLPGV